MTIKKAKYMVPNAAGSDYEQMHLETNADVVIESAARKFVTAAQKTFLDANTSKILTTANISNTHSTSTATVPSSKVVNDINDDLGGVKIVYASVRPAAVPGKTILWIEV